MPDFTYRNLDALPITSLFLEKGQVVIEIPEKHMKAGMNFIDITRRVAHSKGLPYFRRLIHITKGLCMTARIMILHSAIINLSHVVILHDPDTRWEKSSDGKALLYFTARDKTIEEQSNKRVHSDAPKAGA